MVQANENIPLACVLAWKLVLIDYFLPSAKDNLVFGFS